MTVLISILLAIIAAIGAWIGLQQMLIARTKLNNELFDRRFAIYWATHIYVRDMLQKQGATQEDAVKHWEIAAAAPFLFENELAEHIKEISDRGAKIRGTIDGKPLSESDQGTTEYNEHYMWFMKCFDDLENKFRASLSLSMVEPFPVLRVLPQKLLQKITSK